MRHTFGNPVTFDLPIRNADKAPLGYAEIERRLAQFRWHYPVALARAELFVEKAALFLGYFFVLGYDTAAHLVDPRYYGGETARVAALAAIRAQGYRFLVADRVQDGAFHSLLFGDLLTGFHAHPPVRQASLVGLNVAAIYLPTSPRCSVTRAIA